MLASVLKTDINTKHPKYGQVQYRQQGKRGNQEVIDHLGKVAFHANGMAVLQLKPYSTYITYFN